MADESEIRVKKFTCEKCNGEGSFHYFSDCRNCGGTGEVAPFEHINGHLHRGQTCRDCVPSKEVLNMPGYRNGLIYEGLKSCTRCHGTGCYYIETDNIQEANARLAPV